MAGKNPFLPELDEEAKFLARDQGVFRSLSSLFPGAQLELLPKIVSVSLEKRLLTGEVRILPGKGNEVHKTTRAVKIILESLDPQVRPPIPTLEHYLDLCCDLRIFRRAAAEYVIHPFGKPLLQILKQGDSLRNLAGPVFMSYIIERLLSEDGDMIHAVLALHEDGVANQKPADLGKEMRKMLTKKLSEARIGSHPIKTRQYLMDQLQDERKFQINSRRFPQPALASRRRSEKPFPEYAGRRTELEYTVRRDWLTGLGLISEQERRLTENGRLLLSVIRETSIAPELFIDRIYGLFAGMFGFQRANVNLVEELEKRFDAVEGGRGIIETMVLINTALLELIPYYVGERRDFLSALKAAVRGEKTILFTQNGYRTIDYYIKKRKAQA